MGYDAAYAACCDGEGGSVGMYDVVRWKDSWKEKC